MSLSKIIPILFHLQATEFFLTGILGMVNKLRLWNWLILSFNFFIKVNNFLLKVQVRYHHFDRLNFVKKDGLGKIIFMLKRRFNVQIIWILGAINQFFIKVLRKGIEQFLTFRIIILRFKFWLRNFVILEASADSCVHWGFWLHWWKTSWVRVLLLEKLADAFEILYFIIRFFHEDRINLVNCEVFCVSG